MRKILIIGIIFVLIGGVFCGAAYAAGEKYTDLQLTATISEFAAGGISEIHIGNYVADIRIFKSEANSSGIVVKGENLAEEGFVCEQSGGVLNISYNPKKINFGIISFPSFVFEPFWKNRGPVINIYIPEEKYFDGIYIDGGLGNAEITDIRAKSFFISGGVGNLGIKNIYAENLEIDGGLGDVNISGVVEGDIRIDGGVGNVRLNLKGDADDYNIYTKGGLGSIKVGSGRIKPPGGTGKYNINIDGGLGNVDININ
ncbi:MAG: DUF4097 domain-containing protein [Oscillospiraceae bacterium]|nr:DUF4097 domain-containing protein [Oscillospiraceae bacterium]